MRKPPLTVAIMLSGLRHDSPQLRLQAAELKVLAGGSMTASLNELAPQFEKATGHKLVIHFDSTPNLITRVNSGTPFDVVVVPVDVFKDAARKGPLRARPHHRYRPRRLWRHRPRRRAEARHLDAGCVKKALLAAPSIAFLPASAAGAYVIESVRAPRHRRGDESQDQAQAAPAQIAPAVAKGEAELGVFLTNVLIAPGVELAGPFPAELQQELVSPRRLPPTPRKPKPRKR